MLKHGHPSSLPLSSRTVAARSEVFFSNCHDSYPKPRRAHPICLTKQGRDQGWVTEFAGSRISLPRRLAIKFSQRTVRLGQSISDDPKTLAPKRRDWQILFFQLFSEKITGSRLRLIRLTLGGAECYRARANLLATHCRADALHSRAKRLKTPIKLALQAEQRARPSVDG